MRPLCDRLAIALINRGQITEKSFEQLNPPVLLSEEGRKTVLTAWQKRKQEKIQYPFLEETCSGGGVWGGAVAPSRGHDLKQLIGVQGKKIHLGCPLAGA